MTGLEIRSARNYWQMTTNSSNFPAPFSDNKVVGIQWSNKVDYTTWFGNNVEFIHCIQVEMIKPVLTPPLGKTHLFRTPHFSLL